MLSKIRSTSVLALIAFLTVGGYAKTGAASTVDNSLVNRIEVRGNLALVYMSTNAQGRPGCHIGGGSHYAFDHTTASGKTLYTTLYGAMLAGKRADINGGTTCASFNGSNTELLTLVRLYAG